MSTADSLIRSARFRAEREPDWRRLDRIVDIAERRGLRALSFDEARDLATLYRQAMTSLSLAREISLDRALLAYLEALCARAYLAVYAPQESLRGLAHRLLVTGIPGAARRLFPMILLAYGILILGGAVGYLLFLDDPYWYNTFVPQGMAAGRGLDSSREELLGVIYGGADSTGDQLAAFASVLFSNNTRIAILVFSLGVLAAAPAVVLTFYNGLLIGSFLALHADRGILFDVSAWLTVHGTTELSAIAIACAGGMHLGFAVLFPGQLTRRDALRRNARDAVKLAVLAGLMLVVAALLEAFARELVQGPATRVAIGAAAALGWISYLGLSGRQA